MAVRRPAFSSRDAGPDAARAAAVAVHSHGRGRRERREPTTTPARPATTAPGAAPIPRSGSTGFAPGSPSSTASSAVRTYVGAAIAVLALAAAAVALVLTLDAEAGRRHQRRRRIAAGPDLRRGAERLSGGAAGRPGAGPAPHRARGRGEQDLHRSDDDASASSRSSGRHQGAAEPGLQRAQLVRRRRRRHGRPGVRRQASRRRGSRTSFVLIDSHEACLHASAGRSTVARTSPGRREIAAASADAHTHAVPERRPTDANRLLREGTQEGRDQESRSR